MRRVILCSVLFLLAVALFFFLRRSSAEKQPVSEPVISTFSLDGLQAPVYYSSTKPLSEGDKRRIAVVMIHGWGGGATVLPGQIALQKALGRVYVVAPMFPRVRVMQRKGVEPDGRATWNDSWSIDLTKPGVPDDDWRGGGDAACTTMSSYDVIDRIFEIFSDRTLYPNLKKVALVGFSAGGQFVGRYVAVGKGVVRDGVQIRYAVMAPSTYLYPDEKVTWHYGLGNRPRYSRDLSVDQIMDNLHSRRCLHACGELDTLEKDLDRTPCAVMQGANRYERFLNFRKYVEADLEWNERVVFHVFPSIGHDSSSAYSDPFFISYITR